MPGIIEKSRLLPPSTSLYISIGRSRLRTGGFILFLGKKKAKKKEEKYLETRWWALLLAGSGGTGGGGGGKTSLYFYASIGAAEIYLWLWFAANNKSDKIANSSC